MLLRQKIFLGVVVLINAALWIVPSNVVELVARDRHTLLGRYSREHLSLNLVVFVSSLIGLYIDQARAGKRRRRGFQVAAVLLTLVPLALVADFVLRAPHPHPYVFDSPAYHRRPNDVFTVGFADRPQAARTYLDAPPGYAFVQCAYHTDARGFRNGRTVQQCDILVLGDSFAEGSKVSDEHVWPVVLERLLGRPAVNLGMSGYSPAHYLASLREYGVRLSPQVVLCLVYEGNDFRSSNPGAEAQKRSVSKRLNRYFKQSPIRTAIDDSLIKAFGPVGSRRKLPALDMLSWLPLSVPQGPGARRYAFAPKDMLALGVEEDAFRAGEVWKSSAGVLGEMKKECASAGARLVIVYAPTKAHVTLPLAQERLEPDEVHAFAALRSDHVPPPAKLLDVVFARLPSKRNVVRDWCRGERIAFVDTTDSLRAAALAGRQVYYTYDQHWTPEGHEVVAAVVAEFLSDAPPAGHAHVSDGTS